VIPDHVRLLVACLAIASLGCSAEAAKRRAFDRGQQYFQAGKLPEAIIEFRNAVNRDERWGEARYQLAEAYAAHAEPELAYKQYIRAADLLPDDVNVQLKAAAYLLLAGQYDDAKARAEQVLAKHPDNVEAQVALGSALAGLHDLDAAVTRIMHAIQLDPGRSQSYMTLARVRVAQRRTDEARAAFDKAVNAETRSVPAYLARANFQWSVGDLADAERSLKRVLELEPGNILTHRVLATLYLSSERIPEAEEHLKLVAAATKTVAAQLSLADYYLLSRRYDDARQVLSPLTTAAATRSAAETRLANLLYAEGALADAQRLLDEVLQREPNHEIAHLLKARWLLVAAKPEQALEHARLALSVNPDLVPALYLKAEAEARTRRTADAIASLHELLKVIPRDPAAQTGLSALHLARNEIESAVHVAEEALTNAPGNAAARMALVRALIARGDLKAAAIELAPLKASRETPAEVHAVEGALEMRRGNRRAARASFERALTQDAASREALIGLTLLDATENKSLAARSRLESRLASFDNDPGLLFLSAKLFLADGQPARAEELLRRTVALDPFDIEAARLLARLLTDRQRVDASIKAFDEEAAREPTNLSARLMGAVLVHTQGNLADAKARYQAILRIEPRAALAANNLAAIYAEEGDNLKEAQTLAESAADQVPTHAGVLDTLGSVYLRRQLYGPAIVQFGRSVAAEPNNPLYHYHLGLALSKGGDTQRAREAFQRAVKLNPRLGAARRALETLD